MEILPGIEIINKALWLPSNKALIVADLHIGYEEALNKQGVLVPRMQFREIKHELEKLLKRVKPKTIVINGDLKHEFGEISQQEWNETSKIIDLLSCHSRKLILVKGNHDTILKPIAKKKKLCVVNYYNIGNICFLHGHKILLTKANKPIKTKTLVIAHEHPAISISEGTKSELYKCFLLGSWHNKRLVVMPSFMPIIEGSDVRKEKLLSPYLKNLHGFKIFIAADKTYYFGKLS